MARAAGPRLALAAAVPAAAMLVAFLAAGGGGFRGTTRVAIPAAGPEGDPLVAAENVRALLPTAAVLDPVASELGVATGALRTAVSARQIGRGSVVEVVHEGGGSATLARRAPAMVLAQALRTVYGPELGDDDPAVAARATARLDEVAGAAERASTVRRSDRRRTATAGAGAIGVVLAGAGLMLAGRPRAG